MQRYIEDVVVLLGIGLGIGFFYVWHCRGTGIVNVMFTLIPFFGMLIIPVFCYRLKELERYG